MILNGTTSRQVKTSEEDPQPRTTLNGQIRTCEIHHGEQATRKIKQIPLYNLRAYTDKTWNEIAIKQKPNLSVRGRSYSTASPVDIRESLGTNWVARL